jgi:hypothetical protein
MFAYSHIQKAQKICSLLAIAGILLCLSVGLAQADREATGAAGVKVAPGSRLPILPQNTTSQPLWTKRFGSTGIDCGRNLTNDASGNFFATGPFEGSVDFGGGSLTSAGDWDIFLARYDGEGNHLWSKRFGGTGMEYGKSLDNDAFGNIFVTGYFEDSVDFGGGVLTSLGVGDIFLIKYDGTGNHLWSKSFGGAGADYGFNLATAISGNVFVIGSFAGIVDFGGGLLTSAGGRDIFLAGYAANDDHLWSKRFGSSGYDSGFGLVIDPSGNIFVTGNFEGGVDFGGGTLTSAGSYDIFLARYNSNGNHLWSKRFGGVGVDFGRSLAVDATGNAFLTGDFEGSADFGGGPLTSAGGSDFFLAWYTANGNHLWSKRFGSTGSDVGTSLATDPSGNVVVTGCFEESVDFGGGPLISAGVSDIFLSKYVFPRMFLPLVWRTH